MAGTVSITKTVSNGFIVKLYGKSERPHIALGYNFEAKGIRLVNNNGGYESQEGVDPTDWTIGGVSGFTNNIQVASELDAIGVNYGFGGTNGGGGGTGSGDASQSQQLVTNARLQEIKNAVDGLEALEGDENTKLEDVKTKLDTLVASGSANQDDLEIIKTELQAINIDTDDIETLLGTVITEANETQSAILASQTARAIESTNLIAKNEENRALLEQIRDDARAVSNNSTDRQIGKDSFDDTVIFRVIETINGIKQPATYENLNGDTYDLVETGGTFTIDAAISTQYEVIRTDLRATATNGLAGYKTDDLINKLEVIDLGDNNNVLNTKYRNLDTATDLITANVIESQLSGKKDIPESIKTEKYFIIASLTSNIKGIAYKNFRSDSTFNWVDSNGNIVETPITGGEELVRADIGIPIDEADLLFFPIEFKSNTLKDLYINVLEGSYSVKVGNYSPYTLTNLNSIRSFPNNNTEDNYINVDIVIDRVSSSASDKIEISGNYVGTIARLAATSGNVIDPQLYIDANSDFILKASDASLITTDGGGFITQIKPPTETGSTNVFSTASTDWKIVTAPNGKKAIQGSETELNPFTGISVNNAEEVRVVALSRDFSDTSNRNIFRFISFLFQLSMNNNDFKYNLNDGSNFVTVPKTVLDLNAAENTGNSAVIFVLDRELINGDLDYQITLYIYNQNNPNGLQIAQGTKDVGSSTTTYSFSPSGSNIHWASSTALSTKDGFITIAKTESGF